MIIHDMPDHLYHQRPELSSTGARLILDSPAKFRYEQDHPRPGREAFDVGHAAHAKILGVGSGVIAYPPEHLTPSGNVSQKAATLAWAEEQRAEGLTPVSPDQIDAVDKMAESVLTHADARELLEQSSGREVSIFADVEGVPSRARFDILGETDGGDVKSAADASPDGFNRAVKTYGLHIQEAFYRDVYRAETGTDLNDFKFLVVEKTAPYLVAVYDLDVVWRDIGRERAAEARERWLRATASGVWPGYESQTLSCPPYVFYDHETRYSEEINI